MKPRIHLSRPLILAAVLFYVLAGFSIVKLLPWFESMAMRNKNPPGATPAGAGEIQDGSSDWKSALPDPFAAVDFFDSKSPISIEITPPHSQESIDIQFLTGEQCKYNDHRACVHRYQTDTGQPILFLTIHSGLDGEAERFRHFLEGTGINRASYTLKQARAAMSSLRGAQVTIRQGDQVVDRLKIAMIGRVQPGDLQDYFAAPYERALNQAAASEPALEKYIYPDQPLLILETCGWRMPGEKSSSSATDTTGSIYLAVIQPRR